ncbi:Beta-glucosidase-like glycosyl hydrolase, partial [Operophtera brumata]
MPWFSKVTPIYDAWTPGSAAAGSMMNVGTSSTPSLQIWYPMSETDSLVTLR